MNISPNAPLMTSPAIAHPFCVSLNDPIRLMTKAKGTLSMINSTNSPPRAPGEDSQPDPDAGPTVCKYTTISTQGTNESSKPNLPIAVLLNPSIDQPPIWKGRMS